MASVTFGDGLTAIQAIQPSLERHVEESVEVPAQNGIKLDVSEAFQSMLNQLREVYLLEVSEMQARIHQLLQDKSKKEDEVNKLREENESLKSPAARAANDSNMPRDIEIDPSNRRTSGTSQSNSCRMQREVSSGQHSQKGHTNRGLHAAMAKQRQHHKEVHAEDVIHAMDAEVDKKSQDSIVELFKQNDMRRLIKQDAFAHFYPSETQSEKEHRLANMTRRERFGEWLESHQYEMIMAMCLCLNVFTMASELQYYGGKAGAELELYPRDTVVDGVGWETFFQATDMFFTILFAVDVVVRICFLQLRFWKTWLNYVDLGVATTSMVEMTILWASNLPVNPVLFRLLRIGKLARAIRMVTMTILQSLQLLVKCLGSSAHMLFWSFCLLVFVQSVAGLVISTVCMDFMTNERYTQALREEVFRFYGTFTRTFLTMFEIMFANWSPPCRVLVENISEWFSLFFLLYRCVLGFAVLNIINSVFVQQTMKTASSDEELAFKQKEKEIQAYTRKVKKLFLAMDESGDGNINLQEFSKLVESPKLKFWMDQLELEYFDLLSLFEFLDNGDGEITLMEFIDGASRLRGGAKALDVWRLETKLEVLFEEVINRLALSNAGESSWSLAGPETKYTSVQQVFSKSTYSHIRSNHIVRQVS